ncbi:MAG: type II secretion system F family protein, partial [Bacteroidota bacterium]
MGFKLDHIDTKVAKDTDAKAAPTDIWKREIHLFNKGFSNKEKEDFYTELAVLLKAGITLKDALELIQQGQKKEKKRQFLKELLIGLVSGASFSEVIQVRQEFTEYEYHSILIGEESGTLVQITKELGDFFSKKNEQRRNLINALTYPLIILITAFLVVLFMLRLVVPMFQDIFRQNNVELPWITQLVVTASNYVQDYGLVFLIGVAVLFFGKRFLPQREAFRSTWHHFLLKIPFIGNFVKTVYLAQFTRALSLLTASKVPMLNGIELASKMIDFAPLKTALRQVNTNILKGQSLSQS